MYGSEDGTVSSASIIGIIVAISGNVLISLALNCQKLAHLRLEEERQGGGHRAAAEPQLAGHAYSPLPTQPPDNDSGENNNDGNNNDDDDDDEHTRVGSSQHQSPNSDVESDMDESDYGERVPFPKYGNGAHSSASRKARPILLKGNPLIVSDGRASVGGGKRKTYGSTLPEGRWSRTNSEPNLQTQVLLASVKGKAKVRNEDEDIRPGLGERAGRSGSVRERSRSHSRLRFAEPGKPNRNDKHYESDYLKSKLWWLGFLLMSIGETGNFISYAFAPASVVAPLGTCALIANCFFAPLLLKEKFRKLDLLGVGLAIMGAVTVVLSANPSDTRLDPEGLVRAITQRPFIVLASLYAAGLIVLVSLSPRKVGQEHVVIDVGTCALLGGFTVLSTKAFSSMLLSFNWGKIFTEWITYPIIAVLIGTAVGQIMYLNRALMKFDSKIVIPTQFVLFNLSAIIGSAVLYGDFRRATLHQVVTFLYGCLATFAGVFMLTWASTRTREKQQDDEEHGAAEPTHNSRKPDVILRRSVSVNPALATAVASNIQVVRPAPLLRAKTSSLTQASVNLIGLSPAQRLLAWTPSEERDEQL